MKVSEIVLPLISSNSGQSGSPSSSSNSNESPVTSSAGTNSIGASPASSGPAGGALKGLTISEVLKKLKRNKSLEVVKEFFGFDPSQALAVGVVAIALCRRALHDFQDFGAVPEQPNAASSKRSQTEAYWAVDLWGRTLALEALVTDLTVFFDSEQLGSLSASSVRARVSGLVLASHELLRHLVGGLLMEESAKKTLDAALAQLKLIAELLDDAQQAVVVHVRG